MRQRTRKLIGTVIIAIFVPLYSLVIMTIGAAKLADSSTAVKLLFFAFFGIQGQFDGVITGGQFFF